MRKLTGKSAISRFNKLRDMGIRIPSGHYIPRFSHSNLLWTCLERNSPRNTSSTSVRHPLNTPRTIIIQITEKKQNIFTYKLFFDIHFHTHFVIFGIIFGKQIYSSNFWLIIRTKRRKKKENFYIIKAKEDLL